jgi:hypothetical protein
MTKAIKFNLLLDKHPVRDLDDLRANFNLDDLLTAYHSHTLHRWLEVRGLTAELAQLNAIKSTDELMIASALCELFQENLSEADIKTAVYPIEFRRQQQQQLEQLANQQFEREAVLKNYHAGYEQLCAEMLEKAENYPFLKAAVNTLWADYAPLFSVGFLSFFNLFIEKSPLTLFNMLANNTYRQSGLFEPEKKESLFSCIPSPYMELDEIEYKKDTNRNWVKITDQRVIVKTINNSSGQVIIKDNNNPEEDVGNDCKRYKRYIGCAGVGKILDRLYFYSNTSSDAIEYAPLIVVPLIPPYQSYAGHTDGYWKDLQPKGTKCLILSMEEGNFIRNTNKNGEEFNTVAVNKEFLILDGIDYKSNNADHALVYMVI